MNYALAGLLDAPELAAERIDARARGENFPVASLLAPRAARPHLRAIYGFARLVDNLGDEAEGTGARFSTSSSASSTARRAPRSCAGCTRRSRPAASPLEPFRRLIEANRIDQGAPATRPGRTCASTARTRRSRSAGSCSASTAARRARARRPERRRLHGAPARQLPPGPAARPRARPRLPAAGGPAPLRGRGGGARRAAAERFAALCRFEAARARPLLERGSRLPTRSAGGPGSPSRSSRAAGSRRSTRSSEPGGTSSPPAGADAPRPSPGSPFSSSSAAGDVTVQDAYAEVGRITRREARNFAWGIRLLPRAKRQAVSALYAFARRVDDIADDPGSSRRSAAGAWRPCRAAVEALPDSPDGDPVLVALADAVRPLSRSRRARSSTSSTAGSWTSSGLATRAGRSFASTAAASPARSGSPARPCTGPSDPSGRPARGDARPRAPADQHHARRGRGLGARPRLPSAGRARALRRRGGGHRRRRVRPGVAGAHGAPGRAGAGRSWRRVSGSCRCSTGGAPSASARFAGIYRGLLEQMRERGYDVFSTPAPLGRRQGAGGRGAVRAVVVGGGLAGLAAALELVDAGHEVTVLEARPTLGGAVQTLPEREGDPDPPPDNGQHIALGCCTEYLRFLERVGAGGLLPAGPARLAGDRRGRLRRGDRARAARPPPLPARVASRAAGDRARRAPPRPARALGSTTARRSRSSCVGWASRRRRSTVSGTCSSVRPSTCAARR